MTAFELTWLVNPALALGDLGLSLAPAALSGGFTFPRGRLLPTQDWMGGLLFELCWWRWQLAGLARCFCSMLSWLINFAVDGV